MELNPIVNLVFSVFEILKGALFIAVPLFFILLFGHWLRKKIQEQTKWNWIATAFITTLTITTLLVMTAYFLPLLSAYSQNDLGVIPSYFAESPESIVIGFVLGLVKVFISSIVLSLILMPLELVGSFIHESVSQKLGKQAFWLKLLVTSYLVSVFSAVIVLFIVPELISGFFYFLYYGF